MSPTFLQREKHPNAHVHKIMCRRQGSGGEGHCEYAFVKQALLKLVQTFAQNASVGFPKMTYLQSPGRNLRVPAEGFQKKLIKKGRLKMTEPAACVCVCVSILLFSRFLLNPCVNQYIYKHMSSKQSFQVCLVANSICSTCECELPFVWSFDMPW